MNPGPDNPLGRHWLGLSLPGVGIHGTNQPTSIYRFTTHGCIRLHPDDAADLFDLVDVGTTVDIIYAPVLLAIEGGDAVLEVHPDVYGRTGPLTEKAVELLREAGVEWLAGDPSVSRIISERAGRAVRVVPSAGDDLVRARRSTTPPPPGDASDEAPGDSGLGGQPSTRDVQCRVPATPADPRR